MKPMKTKQNEWETNEETDMFHFTNHVTNQPASHSALAQTGAELRRLCAPVSCLAMHEVPEVENKQKHVFADKIKNYIEKGGVTEKTRFKNPYLKKLPKNT
jgi:hypothetical protein